MIALAPSLAIYRTVTLCNGPPVAWSYRSAGLALLLVSASPRALASPLSVRVEADAIECPSAPQLKKALSHRLGAERLAEAEASPFVLVARVSSPEPGTLDLELR